MKRFCLVLVFFLALYGGIGFAQGINMYFMKNQPITDFTDEDMRLFKASILDVLENRQDSESLKWENLKTGANGEVKLLKSSVISGYTCKTVKLKNSTKKIVGSVYTYKACEQEGTWQVIPLNSN